MDQQPVEKGHPSSEPDDNAKGKKIEWSHIFDYGFWTGHPLAFFGLFLGGILLASITSFPGGNPKSLWYFAIGLWILVGIFIGWIFSGIIARMEGRELLTNHEIEEREKEYKAAIQLQLNALGTSVLETQKRVAERDRPRQLTASQNAAIKEACAPYAGEKIWIWYSTGDVEGSKYAKQFAQVFREAGLECMPLKNTFLPSDFENTLVVASNELAKVEIEKRTPPAFYRALAIVLTNLGLSDNRGVDLLAGVNVSPSVTDGEVGIFVGPKPTPRDFEESETPIPGDAP
jgi:hypothetical protein